MASLQWMSKFAIWILKLLSWTPTTKLNMCCMDLAWSYTWLTIWESLITHLIMSLKFTMFKPTLLDQFTTHKARMTSRNLSLSDLLANYLPNSSKIWTFWYQKWSGSFWITVIIM
jgi:hypothetical protein